MKQLDLKTVAEDMIAELSGVNRASQNTVEAYTRDVNEFIKFCSDKNVGVINQISERNIRQFVMFLSSKEIEKSSISRKLSSLRKMFDYAIRNELIQANPISKIPNPKTKRKLPETINEDQFLQLYSEIDKKTNEIIKTDVEKKFDRTYLAKNNIRIKAIFELLYGCALRVSELCSLNIGNLDKTNSSLRILGKGSKMRIVPIGTKSEVILNEYLKTISEKEFKEPLFTGKTGERITRFEIYNIVKKYLNEVTDISKKSPHILRHSAATHMLDNEADLLAVKEILGHENLSTTQIYTHVSIERLKKSYKKAHPKS